jgi:hypothetical protein
MLHAAEQTNKIKHKEIMTLWREGKGKERKTNRG